MSDGIIRQVSTGRATRSSSSSNDDDDDNDDDENEGLAEPIESLVSGRKKRVTAGNRLSSLLEREGDDDLELLFAEDGKEEDVEFEGDDAEDAEDFELDSSSDDEDQALTRAEDDLEGEKELQKQDKAERQKKRKAQENLKRPGGLRKRIKVDPTATVTVPITPVARPRKRSERVSWIPAPDDGPTRSSSRKQTMQNKEVVHQRMKESEKRRIHQIQIMEAAAKRKEASKPKVMTQADRMEEAARTEKRNAKSLNRWEETEKKRSEEQKAKLAALHNRQLEGPIITWWSGLARWVNGKVRQVGAKGLKKIEGEPRDGQGHSDSVVREPSEGHLKSTESKDASMPKTSHQPASSSKPHPPILPSVPDILNPQQDSLSLLQGPYGFLDGIHYYASLPIQQQQSSIPAPGESSAYADRKTSPTQPWAPKIEYSTRNLVLLENIDHNAIRMPELQNHILVKKRNGKPQSKFSDFHMVWCLRASLLIGQW